MRVKPIAEEQSCINDFLDVARARHGMRSDRELVEALHVGSPAVSNWRHGKSNPSPMTCMKLAELAELPLGLVLGTICEVHAPNEEEAAVWRKLAEEFLAAKAAVSAIRLSNS